MTSAAARSALLELSPNQIQIAAAGKIPATAAAIFVFVLKNAQTGLNIILAHSHGAGDLVLHDERTHNRPGNNAGNRQ